MYSFWRKQHVYFIVDVKYEQHTETRPLSSKDVSHMIIACHSVLAAAAAVVVVAWLLLCRLNLRNGVWVLSCRYSAIAMPYSYNQRTRTLKRKHTEDMRMFDARVHALCVNDSCSNVNANQCVQRGYWDWWWLSLRIYLLYAFFSSFSFLSFPFLRSHSFSSFFAFQCSWIVNNKTGLSKN